MKAIGDAISGYRFEKNVPLLVAAAVVFTLACVMFPKLFALVVFAPLALALFFRPEWSLRIFVATFFFMVLLNRIPFTSRITPVKDVLVMFFVAGVLTLEIIVPWADRRLRAFPWMVGGYLAYVAFNSLLRQADVKTLTGMRSEMEFVLLGVAAYFFIRRRDEAFASKIVFNIISLATVVAAIGIFEQVVLFRHPIYIAWRTALEPRGWTHRIVSTVGSPNILGDLLAYTMALSAGLYVAIEERRRRKTLLIQMILQGAALMFSLSLGAFIGLIGAALAMAIAHGKIPFRSLMRFGSAALLVCVLAVPLMSIVKGNRTLTGKGESYDVRVRLWESQLARVMASPAYGNGVGAQMRDDNIMRAQTTDNNYFKIILDSGLVGLFLFGCVYALMISKSLKGFATEGTPFMRGFSHGNLGGLVVVGLASFVHIPWWTFPNNATTWLCCGLMIGLQDGAPENAGGKPNDMSEATE